MSKAPKAKAKAKGLGRGLSALLGDDAVKEAAGLKGDAPKSASTDNAPSTDKAGGKTLPIDQLQPNPDQPRKHFDADALNDLTASIKDKGLLQPILVRPVSTDSYEIVAGERRWRAAQKAQLHQVPVVIRELDDEATLEIALIENIQREALTAIEEARGYRDLMDRHGLTQAALGDAIGKSRAHIANTLRLLTLPEKVQAMVDEGKIGAGHARAALMSDDPAGFAALIRKQDLSVRQAEKLAPGWPESGSGKGKQKKAGKGGKARKDADTLAVEKSLMDSLGLKVSVDHDQASGKGKVTIDYLTLEQLDMLIAKLGR